MKVTFILKNLTDEFFEGTPSGSIVGLMSMSDAEKLKKLLTHQTDSIKLKIGNGSFRDRVEFNQILRAPRSLSFRLEPRRGYRLATFLVE